VRVPVAILLSLVLAEPTFASGPPDGIPEPKTASEFVDRARLAMEEDKLDQALKDLDKALKLDSKCVAAYLLRGKLRLTKGEPLDALRDSENALKLDPKNADGYCNRGSARLALESTDKAFSDFEAALKLDPKHFETFFYRGLALQKQGKLAAAIADYTEALNLNPLRGVPVLMNRGAALASTGAFCSACSDYSSVIGGAPKFAPAYAERGRVRLADGDFDGALEDLDKALDLDPKNVSSLVLRCECRLTGLTDLAAALKDADEVVRLEPKNPRSYTQRAHVHTVRGEWADARKDCDQAVRLGPNEFWVFSTRVDLIAECPDEKYRDGAQAVRDATRACELTAWKNPFALESLATASAAVGDFSSAVKWQKKALADPDYDRARGASARGWLASYEAVRIVPLADLKLVRLDAAARVAAGSECFERGEYRNALHHFGEAIRLDPKNAKAHFGRGRVWAERDDPKQAIAAFNEAIRLNPNDEAAYAARASIRIRLGEWESALADCDAAIDLDGNCHEALADRALIRAGCPIDKYRDADKAVKDARRACELTGWKDGEMLRALAAGYSAAGHYADAIKWQKRALEDAKYVTTAGSRLRSNMRRYEAKKPYRLAAVYAEGTVPQGASGYVDRGADWLEKGDYDRAIADFTQAIKLEPTCWEAYMGRIGAYGASDQWEDAFRDAETLVKQWPKDPDPLIYRAWTRMGTQDWKGALADADEALRLDPQHVQSLGVRAIVRAASPDDKIRDAKQALADGKRACELTEWKDPFSLEAFAAACAEAGNFGNAVKYQKRVLDLEGESKANQCGARERLELYENKRPFRGGANSLPL
jgi:tetratricopeptide (TPR) repeat protein